MVLQNSNYDGSKPLSDDGKKVDEDLRKENECKDQEKEDNVNNTNNVNTGGNVNTVSLTVNFDGINEDNELPFDPNMSALEDVRIFNFLSDDEDDGTVADMNNLDTTIQEEPKKVIYALKDPSWIEDMQEELLQFKLQEVSTLVYLPNRKRAIGSKKVFRNKKDERGIVIRNKARLVAQGYTQEEWIDYDEVFSPVTRIEAIRLFLSYASFKDFVGNQMDLKSAFLYENIEEEVYVCQSPGFDDPDFPDRVYMVEKALYGYIKLLELVYVDDIIFGSTKKELCFAFEKLMHEKFQMSSMGELIFFLGLQMEQKKDGTFIVELKDLIDKDGEEVDVHMYRSMIGSLMYLTSSRSDIMFAVCTCARYQVNPKFWSTIVAKTINEKVQLHVQVDGKEIVITESFVRRDLQLADEEGSTMPTDPHHKPTILQPSSYEPQKIQKPRNPTRKDTHVPQPSSPTESGIDKAVYKEFGDSLVSAATTASSLGAEQDSGDTIALTGMRVYLKIPMIHCSQEGRIDAIDADEDITLVNDAEKEMFDVDDLGGEEVFVAGQNENVVEEVVDAAQVSTAAIIVTITTKQITLAQAFEALNTLKPKMKGIVFKSQTELVEGNKKRTREELIQENTKKQKVENDNEKAKLKQLMETIIDEEEVAIDAISLAVKSPRIVDWKIHKEGKKSYYQIVRADGKSQMYMIFSQMLKSFDREDLEDLYKLVKARYGSTKLVESMDYLL
uniref:Putative reverse transcriptase, RNA-dependent DNA polymerase n=1 Tax=Tanacetum cinerariifolium TaxID=118510 RepID=A0A6L2M4M5_TANCI|nr:putative reverse transcriptase, RNA-dependent DNA polymerase [Tanacetum cinerariifolium]